MEGSRVGRAFDLSYNALRLNRPDRPPLTWPGELQAGTAAPPERGELRCRRRVRALLDAGREAARAQPRARLRDRLRPRARPAARRVRGPARRLPLGQPQARRGRGAPTPPENPPPPPSPPRS